MSKKIICVIMAIILCASCLAVFASCDNNTISGVYYYYSDGYDKANYIELKTDGTFIKVQEDVHSGGTYTITDGYITMKFDTDFNNRTIEAYIDTGVIGYDNYGKVFYCKEGVKPSDNAINYPNFTKYTVKDDEATLFYYFGKDNELTIPASVLISGKEYPVTEISIFAFRNNEYLKKLIIPQSVKRIHQYAFEFSSISELTLANSIDGLVYPYNLETLTIENGIINRINKGIVQIKKIILGDGVTAIGKNAFYGFDKLTVIEIGKNVKSIDMFAFSGCESLEQVVIPESVETMGNGIFEFCPKLTDIWVEAVSIPSGWSSNWYRYYGSSIVHLGDTWEYVNGKPTLKTA